MPFGTIVNGIVLKEHIMNKNIFLVFTLFISSFNLLAGSATATYSAGDIPTTYVTSASVSTSSRATAPGLLTVTIPAGSIITSTNVVYNMTATSLGYKSEQRSFIRCVSTSGTDELVVYSGVGNSSGTYAYSRSNLTIANNVNGGGGIQFELHAFRIYGGSGSNTTYSYVENNSWQITVNYELPPDPPTNFVLTAFTNYININWAKNAANNNVMVAWNTSNTFGTPTNGTIYSVNGTISGGGTILYNGASASSSHLDLTPGVHYYYKIWSVSGNNAYSSGVGGNAITNNVPVVSNVTFTNNISITGKVDIFYDVTDAEQSSFTISMQASNDGGSTYNFECTQLTGDVGTSISSGTGKHIVWDFDREHSGVTGVNFKIVIIADDLVGDQIFYSGQVYNTITIGFQTWLKENINVGVKIAGSSLQTNNSILEKYCYNDNETNCTTYGGLYQWAEAVQYQNNASNTTSPSPVFSGNIKGICPTGWHLPTQAEFSTLQTNVSSDGNKLKAMGQGSGDGVGTNTSGFSALLVGVRADVGGFGFSDETYFWASTEYNVTSSIRVGLQKLYNTIQTTYSDKTYYGFSVRCLKD